jgi:hypothetical protein
MKRNNSLCAQATRLLSEGQGLFLEANKKLDEQRPLDAFLLLKDAKSKLARAASLPMRDVNPDADAAAAD